MANERTAINPPTKDGQELLNSNAYVTKKTAAQGMLDIALLMANASQLNTLFRIPSEQRNGMHYTMIVFIFLSVILQTVAGMFIVILGFRRMRTERERRTSEVFNNIVVVLIFFITIINIFVNAFDINMKQ
ncbi:ninjurin-2-like [Haliotis rubra]|uniref:ninjurin-2-like n=1 Tax=Haliotis rubra TaxID=36100 RepID=UPI001EE61D61|nr:ninjurin-2-like [Haliotis rubra]XP_046570732.1 ninjurin-2-like [Haliotis rubra]